MLYPIPSCDYIILYIRPTLCDCDCVIQPLGCHTAINVILILTLICWVVDAAKRTLGLVFIFVVICMALSVAIFIGTICFIVVAYILLKNRYMYY